MKGKNPEVKKVTASQLRQSVSSILSHVDENGVVEVTHKDYDYSFFIHRGWEVEEQSREFLEMFAEVWELQKEVERLKGLLEKSEIKDTEK